MIFGPVTALSIPQGGTIAGYVWIALVMLIAISTFLT